MKRERLIELGIKESTIQRLDLDITRAVIDEEFARRCDSNYRTRSVSRLVGMGVEFASDPNIIGAMVEKCVRVACPYCAAEMKQYGGGGTHDYCHEDFRCGCGAKVSLVLHYNGVVFAPPVPGQ